ncbi:unnamed protein product [Caenorhabditis angaria]|uniref:TUG ubiquitin-like domain-containing protein n=1 Tax=Caenorhabditis angaria TaxID=860376 RepID=A0A9P1ITV0_9PELO|nr:unnamed protein product [Caenorhabditis angaria]
MSGLTIICPNARRVQVKTTPMMLIRQVLEDACLKSGFEVGKHQLQTQNKKPVDLSLPFRLSGISNNATLEMIEKVGNSSGNSGIVELAIQIPSGARHQKKVRSSQTLFEVLQEFSTEFGENLAAENDNNVPCIVYMNKRYCGKHELVSNSLESLGVSNGKCLVRYSRAELSAEEIKQIREKHEHEEQQKQLAANKFQKLKAENEERARIEKQRQEAFEKEKEEREKRENEQKQSYLPVEDNRMEIEEVPSGNNRDILGEIPQQRDNDWSFDGHVFGQRNQTNTMRLEELNQLLERVNSQSSNDDSRIDAMVNALADGGRISLNEMRQRAEIQNIEQQQPEIFAEPCDRKPVLFRKIAPKTDNVEAMEISDEFFEVKVEDVKAMQRDLRKTVKEQTQSGFMSKTFLSNKNRSLKLAAYKHCVIRIQIGEDILQLCFKSAEKSKNLETYLKTIILNKQVNLKLFFTNQKVVLDEMKNFVDLEIAPKANLVARLGIDNVSAQQLISQEISRVSSEEADEISKIWLSSNTQFVPFNTIVEQERNNKRESTTIRPGSSPPAKAALPKWMNQGRK